MRVIILLTAYAMLHDCVMGCGSNEPAKVSQHDATTQQNQPDKLWTLCCMARNTTNIRDCVSRTINDQATTFPDCDDNDEFVVFLTCLEYSDPCSIINQAFIYNKREYKGDFMLKRPKLIIMLNKVDRSRFFVKTRDQMRQPMVANKSANAGETNYWIGLDMMYTLTHLEDVEVALHLYVNTTSFFYGRYKRFQVEDFSKKFILLADEFDGDIDLNKFELSGPFKSFSPINSNFKGEDELNLICANLEYVTLTAWWYGHNGDYNVICSNSVLTTDDGKNGWGGDEIEAAIMAIDFYYL